MANDVVPTGTVAVLLAAGGGSRFAGAGHKLFAEVDGIPVIQKSLGAVAAAGFRHVVIVTGAVDVSLPSDPGTTNWHVVDHPGWAEGQSTSLHIGLVAARELGADAVVVGLGDQPFVPPSAWRAVARSAAPIAVASFDGVRSPPVRLAAEIWPLLPTTGDEGARVLMRLRPELVSEIPCEGNPGDIDTLEDLAPWTSTTNSPSNDPSKKPGRS